MLKLSEQSSVQQQPIFTVAAQLLQIFHNTRHPGNELKGCVECTPTVMTWRISTQHQQGLTQNLELSEDRTAATYHSRQPAPSLVELVKGARYFSSSAVFEPKFCSWEYLTGTIGSCIVTMRKRRGTRGAAFSAATFYCSL